MIKLPTARRPREVADWIEAELLLGGRTSLSVTQVRGVLSDDLGLAEDWADIEYAGDEASVGELAGAEDDLSALVENAFLTLELRARRTGRRYPVQLERGRASLAGGWQDHLAYSFLVALNMRVVLGLGTAIDHHRPAVLFERLVKTALARYVGGHAARFGVPDPDYEGDFQERARKLAVAMRERPQPELTTITPKQQDHGLDVVAWRSFDDRASKVVILCQCGIGDDYENKALPADRWPQIINFVCAPVRALAIPFQDFGPESKERSVAVDAGILLDRTRIARFAKIIADKHLRDDIIEWLESALPKFELS